MKTTRRHELQTNELADSLAHWIEAVKPYSRAAVALVVAIVVAIAAWSYLSAQSTRKAAEGWNELYTALDSSTTQEDLNTVATRYSDTSVGPWARVTLADVLANEGTMEVMSNKSAAREKLQRAAEEYQAVLLEVKDPMLLQRATFGLARAHEAQGTPEALGNARTEYLSIGEKWPDSPYKKDAEERAAALDTTATKEFYDWLARYEPPRTMANEPGVPGVKPDFLSDPAADNSIKLPSAIDDSTPLPSFGAEPSGAPAATPTDTPATEAPAAETPAAPTSEAPATPPAEAPPAEAPAAEAPSEPK
jgi:hypothetical protein